MASRRAAIAAGLLISIGSGLAGSREVVGGHHERHPVSFPPLPKASPSTRARRSARGAERLSDDLAVTTTAGGAFWSGVATVDPMSACFAAAEAGSPTHGKAPGKAFEFSRALCQVTPLNHSYDTFVARCDAQRIGGLRGGRDDFEARVGRVQVATGVDGPGVVTYAPRSEGPMDAERPRRDTSGTRHCIQPWSMHGHGVEPEGNSCIRRTILLVRVNFLNAAVSYCNEACVRAAMWAPAGASSQRAANEAFKASSYGQTEFDEEASDVITVTVNERMSTNYARGCPTREIAAVAEALARSAGYDPLNYHHRTFFVPLSFGGCEWKGQGQIPGKWSWMRTGNDIWDTLEHELGHNLGLNHAGTDSNDDGTNDAEYGDNMGVMGGGWTFNGPSRMALGWITDGHGLTRYDPTPSCMRVNISALDHPPSNATHTNPHGATMVSFPRSSGEDRYFVSFYALRDLFGSTVSTNGVSIGAWRNQVHVHAYDAEDLFQGIAAVSPRHVAKLRATQHFRARGTTAGDITVTVVSIGTDSAELEIRHSSEPPCTTSAPTQGSTTPAPSMAGSAAGDLTCGASFTDSTENAPNVVGHRSGEHFYTLEVATDGTAIVISACLSTFNTVIRVFTGTDHGSGEEIAFNDDHSVGGTTCAAHSDCWFGCMAASQLTHTFAAGSYHVVVEGQDGSEGTYTLETNSTCTGSLSPAPTTSAPTAVPSTPPPAVPTPQPPAPPTCMNRDIYTIRTCSFALQAGYCDVPGHGINHTNPCALTCFGCGSSTATTISPTAIPAGSEPTSAGPTTADPTDAPSLTPTTSGPTSTVSQSPTTAPTAFPTLPLPTLTPATSPAQTSTPTSARPTPRPTPSPSPRTSPPTSTPPGTTTAGQALSTSITTTISDPTIAPSISPTTSVPTTVPSSPPATPNPTIAPTAAPLSDLGLGLGPAGPDTSKGDGDDDGDGVEKSLVIIVGGIAAAALCAIAMVVHLRKKHSQSMPTPGSTTGVASFENPMYDAAQGAGDPNGYLDVAVDEWQC